MIINVTREHLITADKLATIREYYEFRRNGAGYHYNGTQIHNILSQMYQVELNSISNVFLGILAEICFYEHITRLLSETAPVGADLAEFMRNLNFSYEMTIGRFDEGYDFLLANEDLRIDLKLYATRLLNNTNECQRFNLLVDERQYRRNVANSYIQSFMIRNNNNFQLYIAGWTYANELEYMMNRNNCYARQVPNLRPMSDLLRLIYPQYPRE